MSQVETAAVSGASSTIQSARLLIVDDIEDNRYTLTLLLEHEGYRNIAVAQNGEEALQLLKEREFDLLLLDINMPKLNGYQVLENLKAQGRLHDLPVIMISAIDDVDSVARCVELGAEDYLCKPFDAVLLRARVGASLEKKRLRDEVRARTRELGQSVGELRALGEVSQAVNSTLDLETVLTTIVAKATQLSNTEAGSIYVFDDTSREFRLRATYGMDDAIIAAIRDRHIRLGETAVGRAAEQRTSIQVPDIQSNPSSVLDVIRRAGFRALLVIPLLAVDRIVGALVVRRKEPGEFSKNTVDLLQTFGTQSVLAIQNARLFHELRAQTTELEESYVTVRDQASQLETQSQELRQLNQQLEQRVADQVGEIERMGRLRRFLPPQVADLIVSSGTEKQLESHRREITALFCDLRGFTGFSESVDPEDVMALLREYHTAIGKVIYRHGGTLERFAGDGVMVIFNDPVPLPNPALVAVMMALEMRPAIGAVVERWRRLGHELSFGIGISHGYATLGTIGFEGRFDYAAIGMVSNLASRLCDEAQSGQILISSRVLLGVENAVTVEPAGELSLKGIRRPIAVYNVIDAVAPQG
jgi:adenylate cyclase